MGIQSNPDVVTANRTSFDNRKNEAIFEALHCY